MNERLEEIKKLLDKIESVYFDPWKEKERLSLLDTLYGADYVHWLIEQVEKVEQYEKALGEINEYIPTRNFGKDVHKLKTIADSALK